MSADFAILAFEPSGDRIGADLIGALRARDPDLVLTGIGGPNMAALGVAAPFAPVDLAIVGYWEALMAWPRVRRAVALYADFIVQSRPKAAVLIDSWGFSIRLAKRLRALAPEIALVKYVGPQVWATRAGRARKLAAQFDQLLAVSALEAPYYRGLPIGFAQVGYPAFDHYQPGDRPGFRARFALGSGDRALAILPGSRKSEIARLAPVFAATARSLRDRFPDLRVFVLAAAGRTEPLRAIFASVGCDAIVIEDGAAKADLLAGCDVGLACSGTIVVEAAMQNLPVVAAYRLDWPTYWLARHFLYRRAYVSLPNIAADAPLIVERIQAACRPGILAADLAPLIADPARRAAAASGQWKGLAAMNLSAPGTDGAPVAGRAAEILLEPLSRARRGV